MRGYEWFVKYAFEDYEVDLEQFTLRHLGVPQHLEPQVFDVLVYLVQNHQRLVPKQELLDHIWPESYITEAALNSRLMAARKAIGDSGREQRLIKTVHGRGYRFVGDVVEVVEGGGPEPATDGALPGGVHPEEPVPVAEPAPVASPVISPPTPAPTTSFIGRETELQRIADLLRLPECRLLNVVGPGGVGKTRLALAAAANEREHGRQITYLSLETIYAEEDVPAHIAAAVGVQLQGEGTAADLSARIADRDILLVLDNVEQFAGDGGEVFEVLVANNPGVRMLVTSRVVLGLREEWLCPVSGLSLEAEAGGLSDAARLFVSRASQAGTAVDVADAGQRDAIARICRLVDGMPLAIELAAAITRYMPLDEIANQIERDTEVLQVDLRNVPVRHRSVPGLMNESFRLLTVDQMRALLSLSVFEGSFSADAASAVADAPIRVLSALVDQSLVQPREGRFSLHPLLRQFCRERLGDSWVEMQARHAEYYARFLETRYGDLAAGRQVAAAREIDPEFANIVAAWRWTCDAGRTDLIEQALFAFSLYMQYRSRFVEFADLLAHAAGAVEEAGEEAWRLRAELQNARAWAMMRGGRGPQAPPLVQEAADLYAQHEEQCAPGIARDPRTAMALILWTAGDYEAASRQAEAAATEAKAKGDAAGEAFALYFSGSLLLRMIEVESTPGKNLGATYKPLPASVPIVERCYEMMKRAANLLEAAGERWMRARVLSELTRSVHLLGDRKRAIALLREALALAEEFDDAATSASVLTNLADFYLDYGEHDLAEPLVRRAQSLNRHLGDKGGISEVERCLGRIYTARGEWEPAITHTLTSIRLSQELGFTNNILANLRMVAIVLAHEGAREPATELLRYMEWHPATTPYTRALAKAELSRLGAEPTVPDKLSDLSPGEMAARARDYLAASGYALMAT